MQPRAVAVCCSDLHLSLSTPICRAEKDWLKVQSGYLDQLKAVAKYHGDLPIICAGDIFDRWNPPPELINFALDHLPVGMICVPGQHDLPFHRMEDLHRSGYGVLVRAKRINDISNEGVLFAEDVPFVAYGFGWEEQITPPKKSGLLKIAAVHRYCWTIGHGFPGAPEEAHLNTMMKPLREYDVVVIGDNHNPFLSKLKTGTTVMNCGTFIRRKRDEIPYRPALGIIYSDGKVVPHPLDTSSDKFHDEEFQTGETPCDLQDFINQLEELGEQDLDFRAAIKKHLTSNDVSKSVREIIMAALESNKP